MGIAENTGNLIKLIQFRYWILGKLYNIVQQAVNMVKSIAIQSYIVVVIYTTSALANYIVIGSDQW